MSTNQIQINNGDKVTSASNGITSAANGVVVMNVNTSSPTVNGNGQLGASAMFNLAKIASSDQKQSSTTTNSIPPANNNAIVGVTTHNVVCTGSMSVTQGVTQVVVSGAPPNTQPRPTYIQNAGPRPPSQHPIVPRAPSTITLPQGVSLPPGTILMQNEKGQIVFMSRAPPQPTGALPIQPNPGQMIMRPAVGTSMQQIRPQATPTIVSRPIMPAQVTKSKEEITKCKNFLETLIRLSSQQPQQTLSNVKQLIKGLLEGSVQPDVFTNKLQKELNSQRQPGLAAFLKKSLPELRLAIDKNELTIEGLNRPNIPPPNPPVVPIPIPNNLQPFHKTSPKVARNIMSKGQVLQSTGGTLRAGGPASIRPALTASPIRQTQTRSPAAAIPSIHKGKQRLDLKDDDDINDVATMGGVNLFEETKNILAAVPESSGQLRSCRDDVFLSHTPLAQKIRQLALQRGVRDVGNDVIGLISHACEERLRHLTEKVSLVAEHRLDVYKVDKRFDASLDVRSQLKFLEELDKLERKKHDDSEREVLLKAAKSRSKTEDPEQAKLKIKAREMKEQELEELRQQEANKTALAAIGPRKKRRFDELLAGAAAGTSNSTSNLSTSNSSTNNQGYNRPRLKRVNLRDLTFVLEEDKESYKSDTLFRAFLR